MKTCRIDTPRNILRRAWLGVQALGVGLLAGAVCGAVMLGLVGLFSWLGLTEPIVMGLTLSVILGFFAVCVLRWLICGEE